MMNPESLDSRPAFLPVWALLYERWAILLLGILVASLVGFGISFLVPESYRVRSSLIVLPPASAERLKLTPDLPHVSTLHTLAMSPGLLETLVQRIQDQRLLVDQIEKKVATSGEEANWEEILAMPPEQAAAFLGAEPTRPFLLAWQDLPDAELIPGYAAFEEDAFADKDAIALSERMTASIHTSLETNVTTDFQPILNLEVEWESRESAALVADLWARVIARYVDEIYLEPTLVLQSHRETQLLEFERRLSEVDRRLADLSSSEDLDSLRSQYESVLTELYGPDPAPAEVEEASRVVVIEADTEEVSLVRQAAEAERNLAAARARFAALQPTEATGGEEFAAPRIRLKEMEAEAETILSRKNRLEAEAEEINTRLGPAEAKRQRLEREKETLSTAYERVQKEGGYEARSTDYTRVVSLRKSPPPMLPEKAFRPRHWLFAAIGGLLALAMLPTWLVLRDRYRAAKA
jgi:hypothetical protein